MYDNKIWIPLKGFEGSYSISPDGVIVSHDRIVEYNTKRGIIAKPVKGKILSPVSDKDGYKRVYLSGKLYLLHRLIAKTFIANPYNKPEVNHIDGNPKNNSIKNLEWVTHQENMQHAWDTGLNMTTDKVRAAVSKTGKVWGKINGKLRKKAS